MSNRAESILAADIGSVQTRVVLLDVVEGTYRLVGRGNGSTTLDYGTGSVGGGLRRIVQEMERINRRRLLDDDGRIITPEDNARRGVDYFLTTASSGRPMRAVMVALMPDVSLTAGLRAISGAYIEPVAQIHLRDGATDEDRLNSITLNTPDLIFIAGGTNRGAQTALKELLEIVRLGVELIEPNKRPTILYAGNAKLAETVQEIFVDTPLLLADNVLPELGDEDFDSVLRQIGNAYDDYRERQDTGFGEVSEMSNSGIQPTAQSYTLLADYFMRARGGNVVAVDMGSTSSVVVGAFNGDVSTRISTTTGLGHSAQPLYETIGADPIEAWLPFYPQRGEIVTYAFNKSLRPAGVPMSLRDLYLEHGMLRAGLRQLIADARGAWRGVTANEPLPPVDTILAGGAALTNMGNPAYSLLLIADCVQPTGITQVKADPDGLIPALGVLARYNPQAVVQLLKGNNLDHLGTLVSFGGNVSEGKAAADLTITTDDGDEFEHTVEGGNVWSLPLPYGYALHVEIRCKGGATVNGKRRLEVSLEGGSAGILFDARGRELDVGHTPEQRAERLPRWVQQATETVVHEIPPEWLDKPDVTTEESAPDLDAVAAVNASNKPKGGRGFFGFFGGGDDQASVPDDNLEAEDFFDMADDWVENDGDDSQQNEKVIDDPAGDLRDLL